MGSTPITTDGITDGIITVGSPPTSTTTPLARPTGPDLLVEVTATVVIHNFNKYYPGVSIEDFKPKYTPLVDGSLVCPPLIKDLLQVHAIIIICSALFAFFFRNTFTVIHYIRSGKVPHKTLFYVLLGSQAAGFVFPLPTLISVFNEQVDCRTIEVVSTITNFLSLSLLITGILGVKAYRCLDNSKVVLVGLVLLRSASVALMIIDVVHLGAGRRLGGTCIRRSPMTYAAGTAVSQFGELMFISCCFAWGFWKANGSRPGRLTIPITPIPPDAPNLAVSEDSRRREGWDYIPEDRSDTSYVAGLGGTYSVSGGSVWQSDHLTKQRKSSLRTQHPIPQPGREFGNPRHTGQLSTYALSVAASSFVSRFGPHVKSFKKLLRNELAFTSAFALLQAATSVLAGIETKPESFFPAYCLSMINWVIISQVLLSTFDRVIRRHEKEAMLQNPGVWEPARREIREVFRVPTTRGGSSLGGSHLASPDSATHQSAETSSYRLSDPFRSRHDSWSPRMRPKSYTERELLSRLDPMCEEPAPGPSPPTTSSHLHSLEGPTSPTPSSPRSSVTSSMHILPRQSMGNG